MVSNTQAVRRHSNGNSIAIESTLRTTQTESGVTNHFVSEGSRLWSATVVGVARDPSKGAASNAYTAKVIYNPSFGVSYEDGLGTYKHNSNVHSLGGKTEVLKFIHDDKRKIDDEIRGLLERHPIGLFGRLMRREVLPQNKSLMPE